MTEEEFRTGVRKDGTRLMQPPKTTAELEYKAYKHGLLHGFGVGFLTTFLVLFIIGLLI